MKIGYKLFRYVSPKFDIYNSAWCAIVEYVGRGEDGKQGEVESRRGAALKLSFRKSQGPMATGEEALRSADSRH